MDDLSKPRVVAVGGPTASGKTALSVALARAFDGEIINADSMQIYKNLDVGTAKPSAEERQGIPHYLLDFLPPETPYSVADFTAAADPLIRDITARGRLPLVVGGTGLYMDSLIRGNDFAPFPSTGVRQRLEAQADAEGLEAMAAWLRSVDPEAAERIQDRKRLLRALEVYLETGETITEHNRRTQAIPPRFTPVWLGLDFADRQQLYDRIDLRVTKMLERGLLEEIRGLLDSGVPEKATAMQAIGYKEFVDALAGREPLEAAADQVRQSSRRYAKRQLTWFRRNKAMHWLIRGENTTGEDIFLSARQLLREIDK